MKRPVAIALDLVLVVLFAVFGRAAHHEPLDLAGIAGTAWPFVVGCLVGWTFVITLLSRLPVLQQGGVIWLDSVIIGMLLRLATAQGAHWSFVIVATIALCVLLLGWRLVFWLARGRKDEAAGKRRRRKVQA